MLWWVEAPSGFEPLHRSFADCSLSHLGTAPRAHYKQEIARISTAVPLSQNVKRKEAALSLIGEDGNLAHYRRGLTGSGINCCPFGLSIGLTAGCVGILIRTFGFFFFG